MFASSYSLSLSLGTGKKKQETRTSSILFYQNCFGLVKKLCIQNKEQEKNIYLWKFLEQNRTFTVQQLNLLTAPSYLDRPTYLIEYIYCILFSYFWYSTVITCYSVIKTLLHTFCYCHLHFVFLYSC